MSSNGLSHHRVRIASTAATALALAILASSPARAQLGSEVADPPVLQPLEAAPETLGGTGRNGDEQVLDLNIQYVPGRIFNPATGGYDDVNLRSYTRPGIRPNERYISPAIHTRPGQTVRVNLHNKLPADRTCAGHAEPNTPHCFNGTNLHTHGLWVNPAGNGDNVLLSIDPGVSFEYEYGIPADHPAGTFWYHTHRHGSTALQVSSGMAGALIIHGSRVPTARRNGDLDTLLAGVRERVMVLQQIQYGCLDADKNIKVQAVLPGATATDFWEISGTPLQYVPESWVMSAEDMVDASLAGFDAGELVTLPAVEDTALIDGFETARRELSGKLSGTTPASRYGIKAKVAA